MTVDYLLGILTLPFGRWPLVLWPPFLYVGLASWVLGRER